jgi:hypothetical protein
MVMVLKPQDVIVALKLISIGEQKWTYAQLAIDLGLSTSQLYASVKRVLSSQLASDLGGQIVPNIRNLEEFLVHGLKYVFVPEHGEMTRGIPTGYAAPVLRNFISGGGEPQPVWPHPEGNARGMAFSPLYKIAPLSAERDSKLYDLLALVDAIRGGRAREREIAIKELKEHLYSYAPNI